MESAKKESKEELLKRFKAERIAREKARIQMLHDLNRKKYNKNDEVTYKYSRSNTSLNISRPLQSVQNHYNLHSSFSDSYLNVSAPAGSSPSCSENVAPKRRSIHNTAPVEHKKSINCSPASTTDKK